MLPPTIKRHPTEIFGYSFTEHSEEAQRALAEQYCPYLGQECKKPRKSEPHIKIGVCSVGYKGDFLEAHVPVVVCPHRFETDYVFRTIQEQYFSNWQEVRWAKEVSLGVGGNVDFVAANIADGRVQDFLCVELQAAGTTGTPWPAVLDFKQNRRFAAPSYKFGINWANEFVKTMMQQVYKKGKIIALWRRKIVFVFQDVGLAYLRNACDTSGLRPADESDPIHFCTFGLDWNNSQWEFRFAEKVSTGVEGINRILGGALAEDYPSVEQFLSNVTRKLKL